MRPFLFILFWGAILVSPKLYAQGKFINLTEERASGKRESIPSTGPAIVDINSIIRLAVKIDEVEEALFGFQGISASDDRLKTIKTLNKVLAYENQILDLLESDLSNTENFYDLATLEDRVNTIIDDEDPALARELDSEAADDLYDAFSKDGEIPYVVFLLDYIENKADRIRTSFLTELGIDNDSAALVFFRLGAFLKNKSGGRAIHVEHFDDIDKGPFTEKKSFFGKPLGEEEVAALQETKSLADSLKVNFLQSQQSLGETIRLRAKNLFPSRDKYQDLRSTVKQTINNINNKPNLDTTSTPILLDKISRWSLDDVSTFYASFTSQFQEIDNSLGNQNPLDIELLRGLLRSLENVVNEPDTSFFNTVKIEDSVIRSDLLRVRKNFLTFNEAVNEDVSDLRSFLNNVSSILNVFKKPYLESEKFSEKVKRFTAGNIPETGYIELRYIGERKAGDEILIKAVLQKGNGANPEEREVYRRYVNIERVDPHVKMSGSLILASPLNRSQMIAEGRISENLSEFQFAPTYGIFMKWGSRKSHFYNEFVQFGLGLAFSSPDFSLDGTPEFATGVMATAFRDIISGGVGWNFSQGAPYSFIGFNIPFSIGGLPFAKPSSGEFEDF